MSTLADWDWPRGGGRERERQRPRRDLRLDVDGWDVDLTWALPSVGGPERVVCGVWRARR
jgi:hypothetical protein